MAKKREIDEKLVPRPLPAVCQEMKKKIGNINKRLTQVETNILNGNTITGEIKGTLKDHGDKLDRIEQKVFNGFGERIDSVEKTMSEWKKADDIAHTETKKTLKSMMLFGGTALITILAALLTLLGSVWLQDRRNQELHAQDQEVGIHAPIIPGIESTD